MPPTPPGLLLEDLTWTEAEEQRRPETVVVIPIGAAANLAAVANGDRADPTSSAPCAPLIA